MYGYSSPPGLGAHLQCGHQADKESERYGTEEALVKVMHPSSLH